MRPRRPGYLVDVHDQAIEVGGHCGLYVDLDLRESAPQPGDWIATRAGSRYLIVSVRPGRSHSHVCRYRLAVGRLPKHTEPPADVRVIWLRGYPRGSTTKTGDGS